MNTPADPAATAGNVQRQMGDDDEMMLQRMDDDEMMLQRMDDDEMMLQRDFTGGGAVGGDVEGQIESARGSGSPLNPAVRQPMESAFGADFSGVRVHTDSRADTLNRSVQARAFTTGSDIFFSSGEYNPGSSSGQELLAHELTHVVQQSASNKLQRQAVRIQHSARPGVIQLQRKDFNDTTKDDYIIYEVVDKRTDNVVYIGQTLKSVGTAARFDQHLKKKPHWSKATHKILQRDKGNWTQFEACAFEQWHIEDQGGLGYLPDNKYNALTREKYDLYYHLHPDRPYRWRPSA